MSIDMSKQLFTFLLMATLSTSTLALQESPQQTLKYDGNELLSACHEWSNSDASRRDPFRAGYCVGTILSTKSTISGLQQAQLMKPFLCVPKGIINSELIKLVMLRLEDDDELRQLNQNVAVATALSDAYPCR
ncbi:Rap1a/Tai family immunity protein [Pseudomonas sp. B21-056]|uniref:Rap1a/Tai family immunity protein n=1 Tax=Pseudomonas sp. B21-056 TaxID=2895495 RepID=UPI0039B6FD3B